MSAVTKFSSHWRLAGLNYLEMIGVASTALRQVMKEPARTEALSAAKFHYRQYTYTNGVESEPGAWRCAVFFFPLSCSCARRLGAVSCPVPLRLPLLLK